MHILKKIFIPVSVLVIFLAVYAVIHLTSQMTGKYTYNTSSETVIREIRSLNRLESAQFTIEKVIDAGTNGGKLQQFLFGDRLLLIAHGSVIAGFDLSKVTDNDISVDGTTLRVILPAPQILVTTLDPSQTRVYDRETGLLTKGDKDLETNARSEAEKIITEAACQGGILTTASNNARTQLTALFKGLNFTTVILTIPQGHC